MAYLIYRKLRKEPEGVKAPAWVPPPADVEAEAALRRLAEKDLIRKGELKAFYTELSEVMKRYAGRRFEVPYLERTTSEVLSDLKPRKLAQGVVLELRAILEASDLVKFAKLVPETNASGRGVRARAFLDREDTPGVRTGFGAREGHRMSRFAYPWCLLALAVVPLLVSFRIRRRSREPALRFPELAPLAALTPSLWARLALLPFAIRMLAIALLIVALARPQMGAAGEEIVAEGVDIMLVIDVSTSMLAEDFRPQNRLHVAKEVVADFIRRRGNDRLGMVVFARHALTKTPLTLDHDILLTQLEDVEIGIVPDGTAIGNAIASGVNRIKNSDAEIEADDPPHRRREHRGRDRSPHRGPAREDLRYQDLHRGRGPGRAGSLSLPRPALRSRLSERGDPDRRRDPDQDRRRHRGEVLSRPGRRVAEGGLRGDRQRSRRTEIEQVQYVRYTELAPRFMTAALLFLVLELALSRTRLRRFP